MQAKAQADPDSLSTPRLAPVPLCTVGTVFLGLSDTVGEQVEGTGTVPKVKCIISVHTGPPPSPLRVYPEEMMQPERALLTWPSMGCGALGPRSFRPWSPEHAASPLPASVS